MESTPANPYSTPAASLYSSGSGGSTEAVGPGTIAALAGTKPWVRFMSVLMWLASGFFILMSCLYSVLAASSGAMFKDNPAFKGNPVFASNPAFLMGTFISAAVYFGVFALLVIYPAMKLWKYANRIGSLTASHAVADLESALNEQRRYWKFQGIMVIIGLCFALIGFIGLMAMGMSAAMNGGAFPH